MVFQNINIFNINKSISDKQEVKIHETLFISAVKFAFDKLMKFYMML